MSSDWDPDAFKDSFKDEIMRLVDRKVAAGETEAVSQPEPLEASASGSGARILDLTELLQRSLRKGGRAGDAAESAPPEKAGTARRASRGGAEPAPRKRVAAKSAARRRAA